MILPSRATATAVHLAVHELAHRLARAQELAGEVHTDDEVPVRERHVVNVGVALQAGVVDQDVQRPEGVDHLLEHRLHLRPPG